MSDVLHTSLGYHILRVDSRTEPPARPSLDESEGRIRGDAAAGVFGPEGPAIRLGAHGPSQGESCGGTASSSSSLASLLAASARARGHRARRGQGQRGDHHPLGVPGAGRSQEAQAARVAPDRIQAFLRDNNARILQEAIDDMLLVQRAQDTGLKMPPVDQYIEDIKKENKITSDEQFQEQLAREGMTLDELKRNMGRNILRRQILARDLEPKVMVTDSRGPGRLRRPQGGVQPAGHRAAPGDPGQGGRRAGPGRGARGEGPRGRGLRRPGQGHSAAPSKASGGELGKLARGEMNPELEKVAFALPAGAVSEPIPSGDGYRILKVEAKTEASVTPFDEVKDTIRRSASASRG